MVHQNSTQKMSPRIEHLLVFSEDHKIPCICSHLITPTGKSVNKLASHLPMLFKIMVQPLALSSLIKALLDSTSFSRFLLMPAACYCLNAGMKNGCQPDQSVLSLNIQNETDNCGTHGRSYKVCRIYFTLKPLKETVHF